MRRPNLASFSTEAATSPPSLHGAAIAMINRRRLAGVLVVLVHNAKGGPGKTTCVLNLAVGYKLKGKKVLVVDADMRQRTAGKWPRPAFVTNPAVHICDPRDLIEKLAGWVNDYDVILIDMPGRDELSLGSILQVADILIAPSKPSRQDLPELEQGIPMADAHGVPHIVVFNEATREWTGELEGFSEEFSQFGPFLPVAMKSLVGYRRAYAHGAGVLEYRCAEEAKENFDRVFRALSGLIEKSHSAWVEQGAAHEQQ